VCLEELKKTGNYLIIIGLGIKGKELNYVRNIFEDLSPSDGDLERYAISRMLLRVDSKLRHMMGVKIAVGLPDILVNTWDFSSVRLHT
jgi:hypothetical protein